jgi:hypothetical protein
MGHLQINPTSGEALMVRRSA